MPATSSASRAAPAPAEPVDSDLERLFDRLAAELRAAHRRLAAAPPC